MTLFVKISFLVVLCFIFFMNFESIRIAFSHDPGIVYKLALHYDSRQTTRKANISLFQSFAIEFLRTSSEKLKFNDLLNLQTYHETMESLFEHVSPIAKIHVIPWRLNESNIEAYIVSAHYSLVGDTYRTYISIYQFDDDDEVGFLPYEQLELQGKISQTFQGNNSLHMTITSRQQNTLLSFMPHNIIYEQAIITENSFDKTYEFLLWDQNSHMLVYILQDNPFIFYATIKNQTQKIHMHDFIVNSDQITANVVKLNIVDEMNSTSLIISYLALRKQSISLKYLIYTQKEQTWQMTRSGTLSTDIGVNPKEYLQLDRSIKVQSYYDHDRQLYIIAVHRIYVLQLRSNQQRTPVLTVKDGYSIEKIIGLDENNRLLVKYRSRQSPETTMVQLFLLNNQSNYMMTLRQQLEIYEDCYDISLQFRSGQTLAFVATELEYLDIYRLLEFQNPSLFKNSFKNILAMYALYKFSGVNFFYRYLQMF